MKYLIVNADDLGTSEGVNRGILEAHRDGIVTSASLMIQRPATLGGVSVARDCPDLSVGLHFDITGEGEVAFDKNDLTAVERELHRQHGAFCELLGRPPTHLDSHHHIHRKPGIRTIFDRFSEQKGFPCRFSGSVRFIGGFYAHAPPDYAHPEPSLVGVEHLLEILAGLPEGTSELMCHPGYVSPDFQSLYRAEREIELKTLTDPRIRAAVHAHGIRLISFRDVEHQQN